MIAARSGVRYSLSTLPSAYCSILIGATDSIDRVNLACGDDDVCINRATKMECYGDCGW